MSVKRQLAEIVESLPDAVTVEEAFDRLYAAFRLKQAHTADTLSFVKKETLTALFGSLRTDPLERPPQQALESREEVG